MSSTEELLKKTYQALKKSEERRKELERRIREPIAIVGMACRFPGGVMSPETFGELLAEGRDAIIAVPQDRWPQDLFHHEDPNVPGKTYVSMGGFLKHPIDGFDNEFFKVTPLEAETLDPQQRLLMETTWEALENAHMPASQLKGSQTGVYIGICNADYSQCSWRGGDVTRISAHSMTGSVFSTASGRLSYFLDCNGPNFTIDTACSSSLIALHVAVQALRSGEAEMALAGGVNLILTPEGHIGFCKLGALSRDGRCKTFDAAADGYSRGEGCGMVVLKRLKDALAAEDLIHGVIRGSALNQDGRTNGLTAPNGLAQESVIRAALANANLKPDDVDYVEAHGTGTALGDPIELEALNRVFSGRKQPLYVGSVKTNIGHLESAAGMAGLFKILLAMGSEKIPQHLHLHKPNPMVDWSNSPLEITNRSLDWKSGKRPRIAGLSAFAFNGSNAHLLIEEPPTRSSSPPSPRSSHLLVLSAHNKQALSALARRYYENGDRHHPANTAYSSQTGRTHLNIRLAVHGPDNQALATGLKDFLENRISKTWVMGRAAIGSPPEVAFLFPGQGAQYPGMTRELYETVPAFRTSLESLAPIFQKETGASLIDILFSEGNAIHQTQWTQPCLFATEYALAQLWMSWGIRPSMVLGHSIGEYVAATIAGVFSVEEGLKLIIARARLMQSVQEAGRMDVVFAPEPLVEEIVGPVAEHVSVAAYNGPNCQVLSGREAQITEAIAVLNAQKIKTRRLQVSHAFHSPLMDEILEPFRRAASAITYHRPTIQLFSNLTGELATAEITDPDYWVNHLRRPVRFRQGLENAVTKGATLFLEMGVSTLCSLGRQIDFEGDANPVFSASLNRKGNDWEALCSSLGHCFTKGLDVDWPALRNGERVDLPFFPFQRKPFWKSPLILPGRDGASLRHGDENQLGRYLYQLSWIKRNLPSEPEINEGQPVIFMSEDPSWEEQEKVLRHMGCTVVPVKFSTEFEILPKGYGLNPSDESHLDQLFQILDYNNRCPIHLVYAPNPEREQLEGNPMPPSVSGLLTLIRFLTEISKDIHLSVVTREAQSVGEHDQVRGFCQSLLWGVMRVAAMERPQWHTMLIDVPHQMNEALHLGLARELLTDHPKCHQVALRPQFRLEPQLSRGIAPMVSTPAVIQPDAWYVISGGLGSLGLQTASWLAERGARRVALLGRHGLNAGSNHGNTASRLAAVANLNKKGLVPEIMAVDVTRIGEVESALKKLRGEAPIAGIFHAAGSLTQQPINTLTSQNFKDMTAPKTVGALNLHRASLNDDLDQFVMFSSIASVWGGRDIAHYAGANAFLDGLSHYRRACHLPALSVNWGSWSGSGIMNAIEDSEAYLARNGIGMLPMEEAPLFFDALFQSGNEAQRVCANIQWPRMLAVMEQQEQRFFFDPLRAELSVGDNDEANRGGMLELFSSIDHRDLLVERLLSWMTDTVSGLTGLPRDNIPTDQGFFDLGLDSLMTVALKECLEHGLDLNLRSTLAFDYPNLASLASFLADQIRAQPQKDTPNNQIPIHSEPDQLSYEDARTLLTQMFDGKGV